MVNREITVANIMKAYDNPIAELVQVACQFTGTVSLLNEGRRINAKSIMGVMAFQPSEGMLVQVETDGLDEEKAAEAMEQFLKCQ